MCCAVPCRRGGSGAQRRGGVFDRLAYKGQGGGHNTRSHDRQQQQQFGGGRFGRGRGRGGGGRGRGGDFEGEPRWGLRVGLWFHKQK